MGNHWIEALIEAVNNDGDLWQFQPQIGGRNVNRIRRALSGSLDAAMELREELVPDCDWSVGKDKGFPNACVDLGPVLSCHPIPSVALIKATLLAYHIKQWEAE